MGRHATARASVEHEIAHPAIDPTADRRIADLFTLVDSGDYDLLSLGSDGQPGGDGESADIVSW